MKKDLKKHTENSIFFYSEKHLEQLVTYKNKVIKASHSEFCYLKTLSTRGECSLYNMQMFACVLFMEINGILRE